MASIKYLQKFTVEANDLPPP